MKKQFLTLEGLKKLKEELKNIKKFKRPELIQRIKNAKELGDLSENADYQSAKEEQSFMEGRILELTSLIKNAVIIDKKKSKGIVVIGSLVKIITASAGSRLRSGSNLSGGKNGGKELTYTITGSNESDPLKGKISNESPLGQAMINKKVGEAFIITTPKGEIKYKILEIK